MKTIKSIIIIAIIMVILISCTNPNDQYRDYVLIGKYISNGNIMVSGGPVVILRNVETGMLKEDGTKWGIGMYFEYEIGDHIQYNSYTSKYK